jgi:[ribosomal protein S18]-alanine N-acetyltransferase
MAPTLRDFHPSDLDSLYELDQICFAPGIAYSRAEIAAFIRRPGAKVFVAESEQAANPEVVGFVIAHCDRRRQGHIITLDVRPEWRRHAVGTRLMDAAEGWMQRQGVSLVSLETADDNDTAQAFYARRGYAKLRRIEHYYGTGAAAWLMAKNLGPGSLSGRAAPE